MKRIYVFGLVILAVVALVLVYVLYFGGEESRLRGEVENIYYDEVSFNACKEGLFQGFDSIEDCQEAVRCFAVEAANLIRKEDLKELVMMMRGGSDSTYEVDDYFRNNFNLEVELGKRQNECLDSVRG